MYNKIKAVVYKEIPKHSAYRSGIVVQKYKAAFAEKYGIKKSPYKGKKTMKKGIGRWFKERWVNQRGEVGYKHKNDIYRPMIRITKDTPTTHKEITKKELKRARGEKYRTGRVKKFNRTKKAGAVIIKPVEPRIGTFELVPIPEPQENNINGNITGQEMDIINRLFLFRNVHPYGLRLRYNYDVRDIDFNQLTHAEQIRVLNFYAMYISDILNNQSHSMSDIMRRRVTLIHKTDIPTVDEHGRTLNNAARDVLEVFKTGLSTYFNIDTNNSNSTGGKNKKGGRKSLKKSKRKGGSGTFDNRKTHKNYTSNTSTFQALEEKRRREQRQQQLAEEKRIRQQQLKKSPTESSLSTLGNQKKELGFSVDDAVFKSIMKGYKKSKERKKEAEKIFNEKDI